MDGRADGGEEAELAVPLFGGNAADSLHGVEHEFTDGCGRGGPGCSRPYQPAQLILDELIAVSDQLFLGLEIVVDGLLGDLGLARPGFLAFAQAEVGYGLSIANLD